MRRLLTGRRGQEHACLRLCLRAAPAEHSCLSRARSFPLSPCTTAGTDLLRTLKERSEANRGANKKALEDRYCMRQAELGVGDCGGLRLIPGMTKSGVQKRPEWMNSLFGMEEQE